MLQILVNDRNLSCITVADQSVNVTASRPLIVRGGLNRTFVDILFRALPGHDINYAVTLYTDDVGRFSNNRKNSLGWFVPITRNHSSFNPIKS